MGIRIWLNKYRAVDMLYTQAFLVIGFIVFGVGYLVYRDFIKSKAPKFSPPPMVKTPLDANGILLGKYYGDPSTKKCVTVISVENGIIGFRYMNPRSQVNSLPVEAFVQKFYRYPNGCPFDDTRL